MCIQNREVAIREKEKHYWVEANKIIWSHPLLVAKILVSLLGFRRQVSK
jgi:hypothetical protein